LTQFSKRFSLEKVTGYGAFTFSGVVSSIYFTSLSSLFAEK